MKNSFLTAGMQIVAWIIFLLLPFLFFSGRYGQSAIPEVLSTPEFWVYLFIYIFVFYFNYKILLPELYFGKYKLIYFVIISLIGLAVFLYSPFHKLVSINHPPFRDFSDFGPPAHMHGELPPDFPNDNNRNNIAVPNIKFPDIISLVLYLLLIILGIVLQSSGRLISTEKKLLEAESEKSRAELAFLKAQINPHFLFNILNNIYSLAVVKHEDTAEALLKLSGIMRYVMTDDGINSTVSLNDEVECITDYIYLQKLRLGKKASLHFEITGDAADKFIAPMILITFIENVFKYGVSNHEASPLSIRLHIFDNSLRLITENKRFPKNAESDRKGVGIINSQKRLSLMYPNKHSLQISKENGWFRAELNLQLK